MVCYPLSLVSRTGAGHVTTFRGKVPIDYACTQKIGKVGASLVPRHPRPPGHETRLVQLRGGWKRSRARIPGMQLAMVDDVMKKSRAERSNIASSMSALV